VQISNDDLLDDVNLRIIDILGRDSSTPFVEIAKQIGISDATVHIRVRRLIIEPGFADEATESLSNVDEVLEIHEMHGEFDLLLKIRAKDLDQMRDIVVNKIRILPHILEIELMTVLKTRKEEHMVSLKRDILYKADAAIA
jgi:Lrp/AsnC family transcriptional regulator for asnA, asnC and gidA